MPEARAVAAALGLRVEIEDLGDWGPAALVAEYDPCGRVIRINARAVAEFRAAHDGDAAELERFVDTAIAHEIYHHREAAGDVRRLRSRAGREAAADAYARALVAQ
ncbi:MAG: hypothetical protein ABR591_07055 [Candidatus Velthaea sp.]